MPLRTSSHLEATANAELRNWGYRKVADSAALGVGTKVGERVTTEDDNRSYEWDGSDWRLLPSRPDGTYPFLKEAGGAFNSELLDDITSGALDVGDDVRTLVYVEGTDYGGAHYRVAAAATGVDDGGSFLDIGTVQLQAIFGTECSCRQFGAVDGTDATAQLQAFLDWTHANKLDKAVFEGLYNISAGLTWGVFGQLQKTFNYEGDIQLNAIAPIDVMLDVISQVQSSTGGPLHHTGRIRVFGTGSVTWASRTCRVGIRIGDSRISSFGRLHAEHFYQDGVEVENFTYGNNNMTTIDEVIARDCGSGHDRVANSTRNLTANWSNPVNSGSSGSVVQSTTIDVDAVLPPAVSPAFPRMVRIGDELYHIINETPTSLEIYPWIDPALGASGELDYQFGAALNVNGNDSGVVGVGLIEAIRCGSALQQGALYGQVIGRIVSQFNGVGVMVGKDPSNAAVTLSIGGLYCEGNEFDVVKASRFQDAGVVINTTYALNPGKCFYIVPRLSSGEPSYGHDSAGFRGIDIDLNGGTNTWRKSPNNGGIASLDLTDPLVPLIYNRDSATIAITEPDLDVNRLWGYDSAELTFVGTGTNGAPTGTITFTAPTGWTVNGGASADFSGFVGPAELKLFLDIDANDIQVYVVGGDTSGGGSAPVTGAGDTASRPSLAAGDAGFMFFDTDFGQWFRWDGSAWLPAGNIVLARGPQSVTSFAATADTTLLSATVPADFLGAPADSKVVRFAIYGAFPAPTSARTWTPSLKFGGVELWSDAVGIAIGSEAAGFAMQGTLKLDGGTGQVRLDAHTAIGSTALGAAVGEGNIGDDEIEGHTVLNGEGAVDTTADQDFEFSLSVNNVTGVSFELASFLVELV